MAQLRQETEKADADVKKKEIEIKNPGHGYGGKFGVEKDRMDKSAVGHDYVGKGNSIYLLVDKEKCVELSKNTVRNMHFMRRYDSFAWVIWKINHISNLYFLCLCDLNS